MSRTRYKCSGAVSGLCDHTACSHYDWHIELPSVGGQCNSVAVSCPNIEGLVICLTHKESEKFKGE